MKTSLLNTKTITHSLNKACTLALLIAASTSAVSQANPHYRDCERPKKKWSFALDSGGAHNGPNTSGVSIASQTDRGIRLEKLNQTILACQYEILVDVAEQIFPDLTKKTPFEPRITWVPGQSFPSYRVYSQLEGQSTINSNYLRLYLDGDQTDSPSVTYKTSTNINFELSDATRATKYMRARTFPMPTITFDDTFSDGVVDELGVPDYSKIAVKNLKITYPENTADIVTLRNDETDRETKLTVNLRNYYNCLVNGVQQ